MGGGMVADLPEAFRRVHRAMRHPVVGIAFGECPWLFRESYIFLAIWRKKGHPDRTLPAVTVGCSQPILGTAYCRVQARKEDRLLRQGCRANFTIEWANEGLCFPVDSNPFEVSR